MTQTDLADPSVNFALEFAVPESKPAKPAPKSAGVPVAVEAPLKVGAPDADVAACGWDPITATVYASRRPSLPSRMTD